MKTQDEYLAGLDISYSYRLAKKMEEIRSNPALGYRTAGSRAEFLTGKMLEEEMGRIGLPEVRRDEIRTDAWEFQKAELAFEEEDGRNEPSNWAPIRRTFLPEGRRPFLWSTRGKARWRTIEGWM